MAVGMSNSSPAGARVGVGGTGMSAVLGTETATLNFTRDDVRARIQVTASPAPPHIELNSNSASLGRRRAAPSVPLLQIDLSVSTVPKGDVMVDSNTVIRKQGDRITLSDIHVHDQVNTMGTRIDDHTLQARQIEVCGVSGRH